MSSIDKELARDITVAWLNSGKLSEEYLTKKQVASFYETIFQTIVECKAQPKGVQIDSSSGTPSVVSPPAAQSRRPDVSSSALSKHRF